MSRAGAAGVIGLLLVAGLGVAVGPVSADVVILRNGDHLTGEVQEAELQVVTADGVVRLESAALSSATLGAPTGDIVVLRSGRVVVGTVAQWSYSLRLPSGQTVLVARSRVDQVRFSAR